MKSAINTDQSAATFRGLGIAPKLLESLDALGFSTPTPIQAQAIPHGVEGKDMIGIAQTGTGKTLAFGIPLLQRIFGTDDKGLILVPTRELALQVEETIRKIGVPLGARTAVLIGGASMGPQLQALRRDPHVVIATPGRLLDHLEQGTIRLNHVRMLVLDEADRMLDMGFWPQIRRIIEVVPKERQTMLFSATLSREITDLATKHMRLPVSIEVAPPGTTAERVTQEFFIVSKSDKPRLLEKVLSQYGGSTLVFTRTKFGAKRVMRDIMRLGHSAAEIHGNRSLSQRRDALEGFKTGRYRVLVATDIAARGIDVRGIELVINYDLPSQSADYVHRIGRTARAGAEGHAISFALPDERRDLRDIERLIRQPIPLSPVPDLPPARPLSAREIQEHRERDEREVRPYRGRSNSGGFSRSSSRPQRSGFSGGARSSRPRLGGSGRSGVRRSGRSGRRDAPKQIVWKV